MGFLFFSMLILNLKICVKLFQMAQTIFFSEDPENFYNKIREFVVVALKDFVKEIKQPEKRPNYIKCDEVEHLLHVSKPTVDKHVEQGYYKKYYVGGNVLFDQDEILEYVRKSTLPVYIKAKKSIA
jgi:predicted DNA-binding transcriptional regulator AlpA